MPSCCVRGCGARKNKNQPQLTLHLFPRNEVLKKKWLDVIGIENINPRHKDWYVCSLHFDESCFNRTLTVMRLHDGAVPSCSLMPFQRHNQSSAEIIQPLQELPLENQFDSEDNVNDPLQNSLDPANEQVCRICLCTDRKMYHLDSSSIHLYEQITGLSLVSEDLLPKWVCWECGHYMSKYFNFKSRAVTSCCILSEILNKNGVITKSSLESANWNPYKSSLIQTDILCLIVKDDEEIEEDSLVSDIKIEPECDDTVVFETANDEFDAELTDDTSVLAPTNIVEEKEEERKEKKKSEESAKNRIKKKKLPCDSTNIKSVFERIDKDFMAVTKLMTVKEQIADIRMQKESDNYKNSPHKCECCFRGFVDIAAYERHMERHSESRGPHVCAVCKQRFSTLRLLNKHTANAHSHKFSCLKCTFSTKYFRAAEQHQNYHKGQTYECPHCSVVFGYKTSYLNHLRIKHPSDIVCQHCGLTFLTELGLKRHIRWNHRDKQKQVPADGPACARCDIRFSCQDALHTHRRVSAQHADERTAGIVKPGRNTRKIKITKANYKNKKRCLDGPIPCEQCGELLQNPMAYRVHFNNTHKGKTRTRYFPQRRQYMCMCDVCGKFFQTECHLRRHQYAHSSSKQFKCDRCGKLFQLEVYLGYHQKRHCGSRVDYPCSVCGKTLSSKTNLNRHMEIHKGLSYKCEFCGKVFGCRDNKTQHVMFVHNNRPWPRRKRELRKRNDAQPETLVQTAVYETEVDMTEESNSP